MQAVKRWKQEIFTLPNLLSLLRILLIPVYVWIYLNASEPSQYVAAGVVLTASCLTDMVDGRIARKYNMVSRVGIVLDPVADKCTQVAIILCLSMKYPVLYPLLALLVIKECFQLTAGIIAFIGGRMLPGALMVGKVCTTVMFISLITLVVFPQLPAQIVSLISIVDAVFLLISFIGYIRAYYGKNRKTEDLK